jgi:BASS family bile acid:Na+ symporter
MMLALGMGLRVADFARLLHHPRAVMLGMTGQLLLLPMAAFALTHLLPLPPATAVGLMLIAACPGGATSNMCSRYARGDVALSISLTAISSVLAPVSVPLIVGFGIHAVQGPSPHIQVSVLEMAGSLLMTTALPVMLGMAWLRVFPDGAARFRGPLLAVATIVLILLIIGLGLNTVRTQADTVGMLSRSLPAVALLITIAAGAAALGARALRLTPAQSRTLLLEVGVQNVNLALVVAVAFLGEQRYLGPTLVYLPVMLLFALAVVISGRRNGIVR